MLIKKFEGLPYVLAGSVHRVNFHVSYLHFIIIRKDAQSALKNLLQMGEHGEDSQPKK